MLNSTRRPRTGFTLIELLTVIAIIGILASIIIPTLGAVLKGVKRNVEASNLRSIAQAAINFSSGGGDGFLPDPKSNAGKSIQASDDYRRWMGLLARNGDMADPKLWFSKIDEGSPAPQDLPASIVSPDNKSAIANDFQSLTQAFEVIGGLRAGDSPTTPIGYTRGLTRNGNWDKSTGVYGEWGGHMAFLNGSTQTFQVNISSKLTDTKGKATSDVTTCVPLPSGGKQAIYGIKASIGTPGGTSPSPSK